MAKRCAAELELNVKAQARNKYGTTRLVISRIIDVLKIAGGEEAAPQMRGVKSLEDFFRTGRKRAIAKQKSQPAVREILLMSRHDLVGDEHHACAIVLAPPLVSFAEEPGLHRVIHFRVCERLIAAVTPSHAPENAQVRRKLLLEIKFKAVFFAALPASGDNIRDRTLPVQKDLVGLFVIPHIGDIQVAEETHRAGAMQQPIARRIEFQIFAARSRDIRVEED